MPVGVGCQFADLSMLLASLVLLGVWLELELMLALVPRLGRRVVQIVLVAEGLTLGILASRLIAVLCRCPTELNVSMRLCCCEGFRFGILLRTSASWDCLCACRRVCSVAWRVLL